MYSTNNVSTLYRLLNLSDQELTSNWTKLASLIRAYEFSTWDFARMKAVELLGEGAAHDYIRSVREKPGKQTAGYSYNHSKERTTRSNAAGSCDPADNAGSKTGEKEKLPAQLRATCTTCA